MTSEENNTTDLTGQVTEIVTKLLKSGLFTKRKLTDTPTDALQVSIKNMLTLFIQNMNLEISQERQRLIGKMVTCSTGR